MKAVFSVMSIVLGIIDSFKFAPATTRFLETALSSHNPLLFVVGFVITFFGARFIINTAASFITEFLNWSEVGLINKILGGVILTVLFVVSYGVVISFMDSVALISPKTKRESNTYVFLKELPSDAKQVFGTLTPIFTDFWRESNRAMDKIDQGGIKRTDRDAEIYDLDENGTQTPPSNPRR